MKGSTVTSISWILICTLSATSCVSVPPVVNSQWLAENCSNQTRQFFNDNIGPPGCTKSSSGEYSCTFPNRTQWRGPLFKGKPEGVGVRTQVSGSQFTGIARDGRNWCGVDIRGDQFYVYSNGAYTEGKASIDWTAVAVGILVVGAVAAAASAASSGGGGYTPATPVSDYSWAWDQFQDQYGTVTWRCRGQQTGQFALDESCQYQFKSDATWPGW